MAGISSSIQIRMIPASSSLTAWTCGLVRRSFEKWLARATSARLGISGFFRFWLFLSEGIAARQKNGRSWISNQSLKAGMFHRS
jgi:hypothetical protein